MEPVDFRKYISFNPNIRFGKPCIDGTRISVGDILSWLGSGMSHEKILSDFPELKQEFILAALQFASKKESIVRNIVA